MITTLPHGGHNGKISEIREADIEVGPVNDHSYAYRIAGFVSIHRYHNAASAKHDARRDQLISGRRIEPFPESR